MHPARTFDGNPALDTHLLVMKTPFSPRMFSLVALAFALSVWAGGHAVQAQLPPTDLTHVNNVNAAGNATLHWNLFAPVGSEDFVQNEIKVFDLAQNPLATQWHIVGPDLTTGQLPTGWVMPSFLYDANQFAHCYVAVQVTVEGGVQSVSDPSPFLCSIHVSIDEGVNPGEVDLTWNSPYALTGEPAGGDFQLEKLNENTGEWDLVATVPDSPYGAAYTDNPGPCAQLLVYRVRQLATNGDDIHVSNITDLVLGNTVGETPEVTHVDVEDGVAHVYWDFEVVPNETLGYIVYKCLDTGGGAIVATIEDPFVQDIMLPFSNPNDGPESYQVAAYDCVDDDGTPNPTGASSCTRTVFLTAAQIPCTDRAQLSWMPPAGMAGGIAEYIPQYRENNGPWVSLDTLPPTAQSVVHEGASMDVANSYRVLAKGGEFQTAASNVQEVVFDYPDAPDAPVMRRVSVLDRTRVELVLSTDSAAAEVSLYEFQRWNDGDSTWTPLTPKYPASLGFQVVHVDGERNTSEYQYRYRALAYNGCQAVVGESQEAETILLRGYGSTTPGMFENSLIWTPYDGFANGLDRYEVVRKLSNDPGVQAEPLATVAAVHETYEDEVGDEMDTPGIFCYRVLALENVADGQVLQGAASNEVCLTEDPIVWIPSAFTPGNDNLNDWFPWPPGEAQVGFLGEPQPGGSNFVMDVISRWGIQVFHSESLSDPWDGRVNGNRVQDGVYAVHLRYLDGAGAWRSQTLQLTVLPGE
jgi:hypothetical protein